MAKRKPIESCVMAQVPQAKLSLPHGSYMVIYTDRVTIELLDAGQFAIYMERTRIADCDAARIAAFGHASLAMIPAWSQECMQLIALEYTGPMQDTVKALAARIALGLAINPDHPTDGGGKSAHIEPVKPLPHLPGGDCAEYEAAVSALEAQGICRSDAQGIVDAQLMTSPEAL